MTLSLHDIENLPDGSIVGWQRIDGDATSEAVGIIRRENDPTDGVTTWVTPGGWEPMPLDVITLPAWLIRYGPEDGKGEEVGVPIREGFELPPRTDADYRDRALTLAVQGNVNENAVMTLQRAREYESYLRGDSVE